MMLRTATGYIDELAGALRIGHAQLLGLAREAAQDATLRSISHLSALSAQDLVDVLELIRARQRPEVFSIAHLVAG